MSTMRRWTTLLLLVVVLALQLLLVASWSEATDATTRKEDEDVVMEFQMLAVAAADPLETLQTDVLSSISIRNGGLRQNVATASTATSSSSATCESHGDCYNCTKSSGCHWCKDQHCYSYLSVHGCMSGMTCKDPDDDNDDDDDPDNKKKDKDSCAGYTTCSECGNTHTCHWCAHDNACHTIGSIYGCVRGVDCFSNDRCRRKEPELLPPDQQTFTNMEFLPLLILGLVGLVLFCSATTCWCCAYGAKGAYDDLCCVAAQANRNGNNNNSNNSNNHSLEIPPNNHENQNQDTAIGDALVHTTTPTTTTSSMADDSSGPEIKVSAPASTLASEEGLPEVYYQAMEDEQQQQQQQEFTPLLPTHQAVVGTTQVSNGNVNVSNLYDPPKHARRMLRVCTCFYLVAIILLGGLLFAAVRFFPKIPEYSTCNDSVAWTNLIKSMATLKTEVDFEILMSFENANHLTVALDMGQGIFKHAGNTIGHYTIPPVEAAAMAITDVMIIATVSPQSWEALALTKEYYADKLVLHVDADVNLRIPTLFNYSREVSLRDLHVKINREADRHLCACQKWDGNNTLMADIKGLLGFDMHVNEVLPLP